MKKLKFIATLAVGITIGEFINEYRSQTTPTSLKDFAKANLEVNRRELRKGVHAVKLSWHDHPKEAFEIMTELMFPNRKKP